MLDPPADEMRAASSSLSSFVSSPRREASRAANNSLADSLDPVSASMARFRRASTSVRFVATLEPNNEGEVSFSTRNSKADGPWHLKGTHPRSEKYSKGFAYQGLDSLECYEIRCVRRADNTSDMGHFRAQSRLLVSNIPEVRNAARRMFDRMGRSGY